MRNNLLLTGPSVRVDQRDTEFVDIMVEAGRDVSNRIGASAPPRTATVMVPVKPATARKTAVRKPASAGAAKSRKA